jgi:hypothetical protein
MQILGLFGMIGMMHILHMIILFVPQMLLLLEVTTESKSILFFLMWGKALRNIVAQLKNRYL